MSNTVLVLGAKGRFGRAATAAFRDAGWQVRAFARAWTPGERDSAIEYVTGDAFDGDALSQAAAGCAVIVNALNPPYPRWFADLPCLTASVLAAARSSRATVMLPGNVYNYGEGMPALLGESTPHHATTRKGRLRNDMESAYRAAAGDGVRTVILRAGDFIERDKTGNWFDTYIATDVAKGKAVYPGPVDRV
ncbi:MAG: NAD(P)H-binding protein, partial [Alphaproteobacteria bacterium]